MLRHESEDVDFAEDDEIHMDANIWIRNDPEAWILQRILRYIWMLRHESGDMDLAEEPELQKW